MQLKKAKDQMMAHPNNVAAAEEESKLFQELNSALEIEADMKRQ